ncbi:oligosaccharide flippase family protein [Robiginitomaculum antarcticum]|uniref:oligosaccharide flippase family protein n=1 Tax=Robiginitomaculum antarcticum TaxID=437507 RepID=UPI000378B5C6|nr:oligosaccharide flippase family protein [Robiginitomaculum antarcticum]
MTLWRQLLGYIPVNLANIIVSFGSILILTRILDAAEFGRYALVMVTMQLIHTAAFTWMEASMERYHARAVRKGDLRNHLNTLYKLGAAFAVSGFSIFLVTIYVLPISQDLKTVLTFALISTTLQIIMRLGFEAHKAANRVSRYSVLYSSQMIISFTVGILLILLTPLREAGPFAGLIIGNALVLLVDLPFMLKRMKGGVFQGQRSKDYLLYGLPICFSLILEYALSTSDRFVIAYLLTDADVGRYSAGYGLANRSIDVLFIWIGLAITPHLVRTLESAGLETCLVELKSYGAILLLVTMPAAVGLGLVAQPASLLLGEDVREVGRQIIPWIVGAGVINGMISYYIQRAFMLGGKTIMLPVAMITPMIINIALNFILLPRFGVMGAVYATLISYSLGVVMAFAMARRYFPLPLPWEAFVKCALACAAMAAGVLALPLADDINAFVEVAIKGAVGASIYCVIVVATNAADCRTLIRDILSHKTRKPVEA